MAESSRKSDEAARAPTSTRLWPWFVGGACFVFVTIAVFASGYYTEANGVHRVALGRYYFLEAKRALNSSGGLGPNSGAADGAVQMMAMHLLLSCVGGALLALGVWGVRKVRRK